MIFIGLLCLGSVLSIQTALLNTQQLQWIRTILTNPETPRHIRIKTQHVVVKKYYFWTLKQVRDFKKTSWRYKKYVNCIMEYEMMQYALTGLMKSVCRYNGTGYFHKFAEKYVRGELFRGVTERIVMQPWKHGELYSKNHTYQNVVSLVSGEEEWRYDKTRKRGADVLEMYSANISGKPHWIEKHVLVEQIKRIVEEMIPEHQRMFFYRYDRRTLEPIRTVYYASKLMGFSDETYRKKMNVVNEYIRYQLKKNILHI